MPRPCETSPDKKFGPPGHINTEIQATVKERNHTVFMDRRNFPISRGRDNLQLAARLPIRIEVMGHHPI